MLARAPSRAAVPRTARRRRRSRAAGRARARGSGSRRATSDYDPGVVRAARRRRRGLAPAARRPGRRPAIPIRANAHSVLAMLTRAADACATGAFAALVTAPVQKSVLLDAGIPFTGHTEFFAQRTQHAARRDAAGRRRARLRCASRSSPRTWRLATCRPRSRRDAVGETLAIVAAELAREVRDRAPRIAVCGLNPHAGEGGHLGREEIDVIAPAIAARAPRASTSSGPLPADTVFVPEIARASTRSSRCTTTRGCRC